MFPWSAIISGLLGLQQIHKEDDWVNFGMSVMCNWFIVFTFSWGTFGLSALKMGANWGVALTGGFFTGLVTSSLVLYTRLATDPRTKKWTLLVTNVLAVEAEKQREAGEVEIKGHK